MIRKLILLAPLALFSLSTVTGARGEEVVEHDRAYYAQNTQSHVYTNDAGQSLPYRLFVPHSDDAGTKYPLLLSLHGAGSRGTSSRARARELTGKDTLSCRSCSMRDRRLRRLSP